MASGPGSSASSSTDHELTCPECGQGLRSVRGARQHWARKHPGQEMPAAWAAPEAGAATQNAFPDPKASKASTSDLRQTQKELEESIGTVGAIVAGLLGSYKTFAITCRVTGTRVQVPPLFQRGPLKRVQPFTPPYLETTLGHVIVEDAPLSAGIIMRYAERNPALLRWVQRFNALVHVEGDAKVLVDHAAGAIHTMKPDHQLSSWYLAHEREAVLQKVSEENQRLQEQVNQLQAQLQAQREQAGGSDERGIHVVQ